MSSKIVDRLYGIFDTEVWLDLNAEAMCKDGDYTECLQEIEDALVDAAHCVCMYSRIHDILSDAVENPLSTHDGRLALLPMSPENHRTLIEALAEVAGMNPPSR